MVRVHDEDFEKFLEELNNELEDIDDDGYRLRADLGESHDYHLQSGGDFNAYLDSFKNPSFHQIREPKNWSEESKKLYALLDDEYEL